MSAPTPGPLAIIDRELTFLDQRIEKYQRKADIYARKIGARSAPADALVERTRQRKRDLLLARNGILELREAGEAALPYAISRAEDMVKLAERAGSLDPEEVQWVEKAVKAVRALQDALKPFRPGGERLQAQEAGWAPKEPAGPGRSAGNAMMLVPIEPVTGNRYAAGDWSRRNWEAALEDQWAVGYPRISGEPGGRST